MMDYAHLVHDVPAASVEEGVLHAAMYIPPHRNAPLPSPSWSARDMSLKTYLISILEPLLVFWSERECKTMPSVPHDGPFDNPPLPREEAQRDTLVENALLKRALGMRIRRVIRKIDKKGEEEITETTVDVPPDIKAAQYWLTHRRPDRWPMRPAVEEDEQTALPTALVFSPPHGAHSFSDSALKEEDPSTEERTFQNSKTPIPE